MLSDLVSEWLKTMGLELKPSKTRITHTLTVPAGPPGFDSSVSDPANPVKTKSRMDAGFKTHITPSKPPSNMFNTSQILHPITHSTRSSPPNPTHRHHQPSKNTLYTPPPGQWRYLYRAVDKQGQTIDFLLTEHRDTEAAGSRCRV